MKLFKPALVILLGISLTIVGCDEAEDTDITDESDTSEQMTTKDEKTSKKVGTAVVVLHPTENSDVSGTATFSKTADGVRVSGTFSGLAQGKHGFHIHQYGDCRAPDATSAGGHFNPAGHQHGARTDSVRHMGDMGNIQANSQGSASVNYVDEVIDLNKIIGRAVIIHGGEDDLTSQPSGAAGPRMACGVIGIANPEVSMNNSGSDS